MTFVEEEILVRRRRFTVDEYHRMGEAGVLHEDDRVELIDGEVISMPPIGDDHSSVVDRLNEQLVTGLTPRATIRVQNPVKIDRHSEPQPDLLLLRPRDDFYGSATPGPDDVLLAIEVGDSSVRFDREVKAPLYARTGIAELWLVDLGARDVRVCRRPGERGYAEVVVRRGDDAWSPAALPGVSITIREIFGEA